MKRRIVKTITSYLPVQEIILEENLNRTDQEIMWISTLEMVQDIEAVGISIKRTISGMKNDLGIIIGTTQNMQGLRKGSPMLRRPGEPRIDISRNLDSCLMMKRLQPQTSPSSTWLKIRSTPMMVVHVIYDCFLVSKLAHFSIGSMLHNRNQILFYSGPQLLV